MRKALKHTGLTLVLLIVATLVWSLIEPYILDEERYSVGIPALPHGWQGTTVAVIGDFQIGMWLDNASTVAEAVNDIIEERPVATLIVGDFIYHTAAPGGDDIDRVIALVEPLVEAGIPTYAVLGNHDYSLAKKDSQKREDLAAAVEAALEDIGVFVLENEAMTLTIPTATEPLHIVGVGSRYAQNDRPDLALAEVPPSALRIVMMHHPDSFPAIPRDSAPLAVAGHTHGGQFSLPFTPEWSLMSLYQDEEMHAEGWVEDAFGAPGNRLYVSRGIGMSLLPVRFLTPPELSYFVLQPAADDGLAQPTEIE